MIDRRAIGSLHRHGRAARLLVTPVAAGSLCSLQATVGGGSATVVTVGEEVLIEGFGFFPGDVFVEYSVDGTPLSSVTVTADGTGAFTTTITPQAGEEGLWTVEASDSSKGHCIATTGFDVVGVPATPTPTPTPTPAPTPVPPQGELPNVATAPPSPVRAALGAGRGGPGLAAVTLRQTLKRLRALTAWHATCVPATLNEARGVRVRCASRRWRRSSRACRRQGYGGTEAVVSYLTEELVRQGHDVTLFASGDSQTSAELIPCAPRALRLDEGVIDPLAHQVVELEAVAAQAHRFDVIHWHLDYFHFPLSRRLGVPQVTTLHGRLDIPDLQPVYTEFSDMPVVSISNDQRSPLPQANWVATIHHGLPPDVLEPRYEPGEYLAFLGRISPEKRADRAIEIARRTGLTCASPPRSTTPIANTTSARSSRCSAAAHVEFIGEIGPEDKADFLGRASALLFPIDWSEPFGLVMIESMACGTPVIAYRTGSVPEVITRRRQRLRRR